LEHLWRNKQRSKMSLLHCYLASQSLTFDWLAHTLILANYQTVLRELRAILENSFFIYSLDVTTRFESTPKKLEKIREIEAKCDMPVGKIIFEKSGYNNWQQGYNLYRLLCKYIRIRTKTALKTAVEIAKVGCPETLEVKYDRDSFIRCSKVWREVARVLVDLVVDDGIKLGVKFNELDTETLFKTM
jgi:hypothetical protein